MRLIDADELINLPFERMIHTDFGDTAIPIEEIDNAPTVEPFEPDYVGAERLEARQRGYEEGYRNGMEIGKTLNPKIKQGEWIKHKNEAYECPFCHKQITGTDLNFCVKCGADMKGGAE